MITVRKAGDRGKADRGWLQSRFTFSFAEYHDPQHMGFRSLRVINDDRVAAGKGFGPHAHRDMEILTYVVEGSLLHRDSTGAEFIIRPNEIQLMRAGTGVVHSEFNASASDSVHFFQIWIFPREEDLEPAYQQVGFDAEEKRGRLRLIAAPGTGDEARAVTIQQDAFVYVAELKKGAELTHVLKPGRHSWIQMTKGTASLNGQPLGDGDGAAVSGERELRLAGEGAGGEFLLFDLP
jgi:quercetin 2,3-dioxygenase